MSEYELKYTFPVHRSKNIIKWLSSRCIVDGSYSSGVISSVYYDTLDWGYLDEKANSDYLKTKYRLRWYQNTHNNDFSKVIFFEKKQKIGSTRKKLRQSLPFHKSIKEAGDLNDAFFYNISKQFLPDNSLAETSIIPVFQISYERHRFIDPHTGGRISVDFNISVPRVNPLAIKSFDDCFLDTGVFEFKSSCIELPPWLNGLLLFNCKKSAFSKYSTCFEKVVKSECNLSNQVG